MASKNSKNKGGRIMLFTYGGRIMEIPDDFVIDGIAEWMRESGESREYFEGKARNEMLNFALTQEDDEEKELCLDAYLTLFPLIMAACDKAFPA